MWLKTCPWVTERNFCRGDPLLHSWLCASLTGQAAAREVQLIMPDDRCVFWEVSFPQWKHLLSCSCKRMQTQVLCVKSGKCSCCIMLYHDPCIANGFPHLFRSPTLESLEFRQGISGKSWSFNIYHTGEARNILKWHLYKQLHLCKL